MVRHSVFRWTVATLALSWAGTAWAGPIGTDVSPLFKTGDVEKDFSSSSPSVTVVPGLPINAAVQPQWMTDAGLVNGYVMKDLRLSYDKNSDTLSVGVNFWGIAGNTDGSPDGSTNPLTSAKGGSNPMHLGLDKSINVTFAPVTASGTAGTPLVVAGVPADKSHSPAGSLDGFTVAAYKGPDGGPGRSFGSTLTNNLGALAYDPSKDHPDFEFTIKNFSKIPGLNALSKGFFLSANTSSAQTLIVGKTDITSVLIGSPLAEPGNLLPPPVAITPPAPGGMTPPKPPIENTVPEPATLLGWGLVAGGAAWRVRRRIRPSTRP